MNEVNFNKDNGTETDLASAGQVKRWVMLPMPSDIERVETGAVQFGDDWPGVFIRGDNAAYYSMALDVLLNGSIDPISLGILSGLNELLKSSSAI